MPARHASPFLMSTPAPNEIYNLNVYLTALIASMGAFIFGYDLAFIGTTITLPPFKKDFGLLHASQSTSDLFSANIVSLLQAGCFFGSLAVQPLGDRFGRKPALMIAGILFCIGSLMQTLSSGIVVVMFLGRAIGGLGVGLASGIVPLYIAELAPPQIRGRLVGIYEISVQAGTCVGFWICYGVKKHMASTAAQWITPFAVQLLPGGLLIIGMFFVPESPRWLAQHRSRDAASAALVKMRQIPADHLYLIEELSQIMDVADEEAHFRISGGAMAKWRACLTPSNRKRLLLGVAVFVFMQLAGSNAINYYSPRIFASIGLTGSSTGLYATGIYGVVRLCCVIPTMYFFVDRFGRRSLLMLGAVIMLIGMWFIGAYIKIAAPSASTSELTAGGYAAVTMIYIYAIGYCLSYAGIPWIYCAEIFPLQIRGIGMAACTATHWLLNFAVARSVPYMISNIEYGTYFFFAACITLSIPFVYFFLPETKGLSLEEVDVLFEGPGGVASEILVETGKLPETDHVEHVHVEGKT